MLGTEDDRAAISQCHFYRFFRPMGLGVLFGLALFQVLLVLTTSLPVLKKLREGADGEAETSGGTATPEQATASNDGLAPKD